MTSGPEITELAAAYGLILDPWQAYVLEGAMGEAPDGKWAATRVGLSVPRQNGKNGIIEARELGGLLLLGEQLMIHSAHEVKTALEAFLRIRAYFENYDDLSRLVRRINSGRGAEEIILKSGQRLKFMARSKGSGRGFSADCLILDEAQELPDAAFSAMLPTLSARPNPQIWLTGTPPGPNQNGEVFANMRKAGLEGSPRAYYAEWSADPSRSPDDREGWAEANPALGIRLTEEWIADERESLSEDGFVLERLGVWEGAQTRSVIPMDTWATLAAPAALAEPPKGVISVGVDTDPGRTVTTVSVALPVVCEDGVTRSHVEVIQSRRGVDWARAYVRELVQRRQPRAVVIDSAGAAASLIEPLRRDGVLVTATGAGQMKQAAGLFYDLAMENGLRHSDQPQLNTALSVARKRVLGDAWAWHRKDATDDITPLVSATLALWGLHAEGVAKPRAVPKQKEISRTYYSLG